MIKNLSKVLIVLSLNLIVGCSAQEKNLTIDGIRLIYEENING